MSDIALQGPGLAHRILRGAAIVCAAGLAALLVAFARPHVVGALYELPRLESLFAKLHDDEVLISALNAQNIALADKDEAWALAQDKVWNAERLSPSGQGTMQQAVMQRPASRHLRDIVAGSQGLVTHAFLIDAKGRIAAEPFPSYNFWQLDKPKFHYTFPKGAGARDVSWLERSWDGTHPVCWWAETMVDPKTAEPIGVLALEVNYLEVGYFGCRETPAHTAEERATNHVKL